MKSQHYDYIFLGTGIISILEACYQSKLGKSVLMIDKNPEVGGAWQPINIFGYNNVENAIHYFLEDTKAPDFMKNNLSWDIVEMTTKQRLLRVPLTNKHFKFKFNNIFGRFLSYLLNQNSYKNKNIFKAIFDVFKKVTTERNHTSYYIVGGAPVMMETVKNLIRESSIYVQTSTNIDSISIHKTEKRIELKSGSDYFHGNKLVFTHGSRLPNIISEQDIFVPNEKYHPRPAVHLLIEDHHKNNTDQWIFSNHKIIKYVHDLTNMVDKYNDTQGEKIFVFALHPNIQKSEDIYSILHSELCKAGIVHKNSRLRDSYWTDVFLPTLYDEDLVSIEENFSPQMTFMKTENFAAGVGYYAKKWSKKIKV